MMDISTADRETPVFPMSGMSNSTFYDENLDTSYLIEEAVLDEPAFDVTPTYNTQDSSRSFSQQAASTSQSVAAARPGPYLRRMNSGDLGRGSSRATPAGFTQPPLAPVRTTSAERATRKSVPVLAVSCMHFSKQVCSEMHALQQSS
jgi:hypothetical protein